MSDQKPYGDTHTEDKDRVQRLPGRTMRKVRVRDWCYRQRELARRNNPNLSETALDQAVKDSLAEYEQMLAEPGVKRIYEDTELVSRSIRPSSTDEVCEMAAMRSLDEVKRVFEPLAAYRGERGPARDLSMAISVITEMSLGRPDPEIAATIRRLTRKDDALRLAHNYPAIKARSAIYHDITKILEAVEPQGIQEANIALIQKLRETLRAQGRGAESRQWPRNPGGRRAGEPYMIGEVGIVDGMKLPAPVKQQWFDNEDHRRLHLRPGQKKVRASVYKDSKGNYHSFTFGYRLVMIADMATGLPLIWKLASAGCDERDVTSELLAELFELWPECPMDALVGDSYFDHSKAFNHDLVFKWGIQPIFVSHGGNKKGGDGVPRCSICSEPMKLLESEICTAEKRARRKILRGQPAPIDVALVWKCSCGSRRVRTKPFENPTSHTHYPKAGDHRRALERKTMLARRNVVEGIFAELQRRGIGAGHYRVPRWANSDQKMEWFISLGVLGITARRLIHETGAYRDMHHQLESFGLLTPNNPSPTEQKLADSIHNTSPPKTGLMTA